MKFGLQLLPLFHTIYCVYVYLPTSRAKVSMRCCFVSSYSVIRTAHEHIVLEYAYSPAYRHTTRSCSSIEAPYPMHKRIWTLCSQQCLSASPFLPITHTHIQTPHKHTHSHVFYMFGRETTLQRCHNYKRMLKNEGRLKFKLKRTLWNVFDTQKTKKLIQEFAALEKRTLKSPIEKSRCDTIER